MVYLVRHGQTDWNLQKRFNGRTDIKLNETGLSQSKQQAENLKNVCFDACFCSPHKRARQTCELICKEPIVFDDRLSEIDCGEFEGTEESAESLKLFWQAIKSGDKGTECFRDFMKRCCDFCDMITKDYKGKNILIVTHAANIRVIEYYYSGKPDDYDFMKPNIVQNGGLLTYEN